MHEKKVRMTDFTRKYLPSQDVLKLRVFTHGQILNTTDNKLSLQNKQNYACTIA